jgi:hypothetical protein
MGRNYLWYRRGDAANAILAAVGYNFRGLIRWLSILWRLILSALLAVLQTRPSLSATFFTDDHLGRRKPHRGSRA